MLNYFIDSETLNIKYDFENLSDQIKNLIVENNIKNINFYSNKYELLNQFNFPGCQIKSLIITSPGNNILDVYKPVINIGNLPLDLESLEIARDCIEIKLDTKLIQNLPSKLKKLKLHSCKNVSLDNLPNTLEILDISCFSYQTNLLDYLPASLKSLNIKLNRDLKSEFNIRSGLESESNMELGFNLLPSGLENLKIIGKFDGELNCLPMGLKILHLPSNYTNDIKNIPKNLQELKIPLEYKYMDRFNVCVELKKIIIGFTYRSVYKNPSNFNLKMIPNSVEEIEFGDNFNQNLDWLPSNIKKIKFGFNFSPGTIEFIDPIEHLEFGYRFNGIVLRYPTELKYLKFGRNFNQNLNNLPEKLINLSINERYRLPINKLPSSLEILEFDYSAEYNGDIMCIPDSTHTIILGKYMVTNKINIPTNLKKITYSESNTYITDQLDKINFAGTIGLIKKEVY